MKALLLVLALLSLACRTGYGQVQKVEGPTPAGTVEAGRPVPVGGVDPMNIARTLSTDNAGRLNVNSAGGGGCPGTQATPCVTAGQDGGAVVRIFSTDGSGRLNVVVFSLPSIPAGANNIGSVNVATLPSIPAGGNNIGSVNVANTPNVAVTSLPSIPAGANNIGSVNVANTPNVVVSAALPAGANNIGSVNVANTPNVAVTSVPANMSVNLNQVAGNGVVTGGVSGSQGVGGLAADGGAAAGNPNMQGGFDGTNVRDVRTASLTNYPTAQTLVARNSVGAPISEKGSRWSVVNNSDGGTAAATIAAEAGVRHVVDCITISAVSTGAVTASRQAVSILDGGTRIWFISTAFGAAVASGVQEVEPFATCGLNLVGTTNTLMTLQFDGSNANVQEIVSISGYNVN